MKTWAILNESLKRYWNDLTSSWVEAADAAVLYVEPEAAHEEARRLLKADGSMQLKIVEILPDSLKRVDRSQVVEESIHEFAAEASELGWPPGYLPTVLATNLGNGQPFMLNAFDDRAFVYQQSAGCITLTVFND
jgi:hypothetical protein